MFKIKDALDKAMLDSGELRVLTDEELKQVQECLIDMYKDILVVCQKYGLTPMLAGGSALGAIRHKGFIPWDDDLDVMMLREEYDKFFPLFEQEKGDEYYVNAPHYKDGAQLTFGRIYKKGTTKINLHNRNTNYPKGVFIDLFPVDFAPNHKFIQVLKSFYVDSIRFISYSVFQYQHREKYILEATNNNMKAFLLYRFRLFIGFLFSFLPYKKWFYLYDRASRGKESNYMTIASGRNFYYKELLPKEDFCPGRTEKFAGIDAPVPYGVERYLTQLYGDYMQIPPVEKREKHIVYKFDLYHEYSE